MKFPISKPYRNFCIFETVAINGVGCTTLVLQDTLRESNIHPGLCEYWFVPPVPYTETEHLMTFMIAGWLGTAGILQAFINLDDLVPKRTRLAALYSFAACDIIWIILMVQYIHLFSPYHIVGSAYTIAQRFQYVKSPNSIFNITK